LEGKSGIFSEITALQSAWTCLVEAGGACEEQRMLENVEAEVAEVAEVRVAAVEVVAVVEVDDRRRPVRPPKLRVIGG
jgi:GTP cyclohydrolase III